MGQWRQEILKHLEVDDIDELRQALSDPKKDAKIVSDGGVHHYHSNFGPVIAVNGTIVASNMGNLYSIQFHESSYCSELFGMLAATVTLHHILEEHEIGIVRRQTTLNFYCDNKSVMKTINACLEMR
jgi:hypothetical protein